MKTKTKQDPFKFKLNSKCSLQEMFCKHFHAGLFTDCTIVAMCGKSLNLHRVILATYSDYFAVLFTKRPSDVNIVIAFPELEFEDLMKVITCIYFGELAVEEDSFAGFIFALETLHIKGVEAEDSFTTKPKAGAAEKSKEKPVFMKTRFSGITSNSPSIDPGIDKPSEATPVDIDQPPVTTPVNQHNLKELKVILRRVSFDPEATRRPNVAKETSPALTQNRRNGNDIMKQVWKRVSQPVKDKGQVGFPCDFCSKNFKLTINKNRHQKICRSNPDRDQLLSRLSCRFCSRTFAISSRYRLLAHERVQHQKEIDGV